MVHHKHDGENKPNIMSCLYSILLTQTVRMYDLSFIYVSVFSWPIVHYLLVSEFQNGRLLPCNSLLLYLSCEDVA
jgi:hypothetical protein